MKEYALVIDYDYCTGCHTCEVACKQEKELGKDEWGIKLTHYGPVPCGDGWSWNYVPVPTDACDLCAERVEQGKKPACVHHCLAQCMELVAIDGLPDALRRLGSKTTCFVP